MTNPALALQNIFTSPNGKNEINFRNKTNERDSVSSIEIKQGQNFVVLPIKTEDNVAMALALLGVGRVTPEIEGRAQNVTHSSVTEGQLIESAVTNLRAALLLREKEAVASVKDLDDAFALYKLSYPRAIVTRETFATGTMSEFWTSNLRKLRQDPTVLGAL